MQSKLTLTLGSAAANSRGRLKLFLASGLWLGCLCGFAGPLGRRKGSRALSLLGLALVSAALAVALACGGGGGSPAPGTASAQPEATFNVVAVSGGITHKRTLTLSH